MNNKSNFLNLPSGLPGDARRHVPFTSIIHKPLCLIFVFVFVFSVMFSYVHPVTALADPVPEFTPIYDTQFYQIPQAVGELSSQQLDIFYFYIGSAVGSYSSLNDVKLDTSLPDEHSVGDWFKNLGKRFYNDIIDSFLVLGWPIAAGVDLINYMFGSADKASTFDPNLAFYSFLDNEVINTDTYLLFDSNLFKDINQVIATNQGLFNWQFSEGEYSSNFNWRIRNMSGTLETEYNNRLNNLGFPRVPANFSKDYVANLVFSPDFTFDLFINISNHTINFINFVGSNTFNYVCTDWYNAYSGSTGNITFQSLSYNPNNFNNYIEVAQYALDNMVVKSPNFNPTPYQASDYIGYATFPLSTLVNKVYYGLSTDDLIEVHNVAGLDIHSANSYAFDNIMTQNIINLTQFINDIVGKTELADLALGNITLPNGDPLPVSDVVPVSVAVELPESGINIPNDLFSPLTKEGGYISYLWYMTKPLVQYTSDFVQTMVFDGTEDFDITGPGAIVFGVISLGLIGGLVVKCLL